MGDIISETFEKVKARYGDHIDSLALLPHVVATFMFIHAAQGVIDNGGYRYFFGSNWPGCPPYSKFVEAYIEIGCKDQAKELERVLATFPFDNSHLHEDARKKYMNENYDKENFEVLGWGDALCGDEQVWDKLAEYCKKHEGEFA